MAYLVEEVIAKGELFDWVSETGPFAEPFVRYYAKQMLSGINYIHNQGVAHRDLKCENIMLDEHLNIKIVDFGFAANAEGRDASGKNNTYCGTLSYMAPEIHEGRPYRGSEVDLFALSIIIFMLFAGHRPFDEAN